MLYPWKLNLTRIEVKKFGHIKYGDLGRKVLKS